MEQKCGFDVNVCEVIATHTHIIKPYYLSVSNHNVIYLTSYMTGMNQTTEDSVSRYLIFYSANR